jgi:HD-like signal output (HDOD) protein
MAASAFVWIVCSVLHFSGIVLCCNAHETMWKVLCEMKVLPERLFLLLVHILWRLFAQCSVLGGTILRNWMSELDIASKYEQICSNFSCCPCLFGEEFYVSTSQR